MTKLRPPLTPYRALSKIADLLGWDGCAAVMHKSESTVRKWGDPEAEREISFQSAIRLDAAYRRAGGTGAPLLECYTARLDLASDTDENDQVRLLAATGKAAKEAGEAVGAALDAAAKVDDIGMRAKAIIETEEGIEAMHSLLFSLKNGA